MKNVLLLLRLLLAISIITLSYSCYKWGDFFYAIKVGELHEEVMKENIQYYTNLGNLVEKKRHEDGFVQYKHLQLFLVEAQREWLYKIVFNVAVTVLFLILSRMEIMRRRRQLAGING